MATSSALLRSCISPSSPSLSTLARKTGVGVCRARVADSTVERTITKKKEKDLCALEFVRKVGKETRLMWKLHAERAAENGVISCRLFALIGVAGTLMGSILCFVEGCFLVWSAFLLRFQASWENLELAGEAMTLIVEAAESFLVGSAMISFGMGLFAMFVSSRGNSKEVGFVQPGARMECLSEAKAELGRAVVMLLQGGLVDKFKSTTLCSCADLVCFAGAIFISSASIFLLSRLRRNQRNPRGLIPAYTRTLT